MSERYDPHEPQMQTFDPDHPDLGWTYAEPLPYYTQHRPSLISRIRLLFLSRCRCKARWCTWPATEVDWYCDRHAPGLSEEERP